MFGVSQDMSDSSSQLIDPTKINNNQSEQPAWYQKEWVKPEQFFSSPTGPYFRNNSSNSPNQDMTRFWRPSDCIMNSNPSIGEIVHNISASDIYQWQAIHPKFTSVRRAPNKTKRNRTAFTTDQIRALEDVFQQESYVSKPEREKLCEQLGLNDRAIKVWFQNRRMKDKKIAEEIENSHNIPNVYNAIDNVISEINNSPVQNDYVNVSPVVVDKLGEIIHRMLPSDLNVVEKTEQCAEIPNNINKNYAINSSENSESGIDMEYKPRDQDVNGSEQRSSYETNCSGIHFSTDSPVKEKLTPDKLQMLFDQHFC